MNHGCYLCRKRRRMGANVGKGRKGTRIGVREKKRRDGKDKEDRRLFFSLSTEFEGDIQYNDTSCTVQETATMMISIDQGAMKIEKWWDL